MRKEELIKLKETINNLKEMSTIHYVKTEKLNKDFIVIRIHFNFKVNSQVIEIIKDSELGNVTAKLYNQNNKERIIEFFDIKG